MKGYWQVSMEQFFSMPTLPRFVEVDGYSLLEEEELIREDPPGHTRLVSWHNQYTMSGEDIICAPKLGEPLYKVKLNGTWYVLRVYRAMRGDRYVLAEVYRARIRVKVQSERV